MSQGNDPAQRLKLCLTCLQNVLHKQENNAIEKQKIQRIVKRYSQESTDIKSFARDVKEIKNYMMFKLLYDGYVAFHEAYLQLLRGQFSKDLDEKYDISELLLRVIPKINLLAQSMTPNGVITKFHVPLLSQTKKMPKQPANFVKRWREKASEKLQSKSIKKPTAVNPPPDREVPQPVQNTSFKKVETKREASDDESVDIPKQKSSRVADKHENERAIRDRERMEKEQKDRERHEQRSRRVNRQQEQNRRTNEKTKREQLTKKADIRQNQKISKGKISAIQSYIDSRKDLFCQRSKIKDVSQHLACRLDEFLKNAMEEMYNAACLRNKKNPKFGNELGYLSEQSNRINHNQEFYFHPNTKIYNLTFKHKHTLYNILRTNEVKKQDEMRAQLEEKTAQGDKKIDKKIENYILKPRPKESDTIFLQYREEKDGIRSESVTISIEHVIHFLENHPWLNNSLLLFDVYHRF